MTCKDAAKQDLQQPLLDGRKEGSAPMESLSGHDMSKYNIFAYGVGHVLNDLCASCWFTYLLFFLTDIKHLPAESAGAVMLAGQVADGVFTPLVGYLSDKTDTRFGRRKPWYVGGTILVALCFTFIFGTCVPCDWFDASSFNVVATVYYSICASLFNVGWAAVQVSHMSMIPELTEVDSTRVLLNSVRYAGTVIANVIVLLLAMLLFWLNSDSSQADRPFLYLAVICVALGLATSVIFLTGVKENPVQKSFILPPDSPLWSPGGTHRRRKTWWCWVKQPVFYVVGSIYMCSRLATNISQSFMPFYLSAALNMTNAHEDGQVSTPISFALVPLLTYVGQLAATYSTKVGVKRYGRKWTLVCGTVIVGAAATTMMFLNEDSAPVIYPTAFVLGVGLVAAAISAASIQCDMLGRDCKSSAFVYGAHSLLDKLSCGIAVFGIQQSSDLKGSMFQRIVTALIPAISLAAGSVIALFGAVPKALHECHDVVDKESQYQALETDVPEDMIYRPASHSVSTL
eukprot:GILK01005142.1.p1 GENE.GILK01005142.1~~GILK01005142.1.p1  ORF type:complete len:514 (+),score=50.78 GILK01005142.1:55-1596(+)